MSFNIKSRSVVVALSKCRIDDLKMKAQFYSGVSSLKYENQCDKEYPDALNNNFQLRVYPYCKSIVPCPSLILEWIYNARHYFFFHIFKIVYFSK